jgi:hypothetical protein
MKRSRGDDNALQFLYKIPRTDFTASDAAQYAHTFAARSVPVTVSGWRKRLARLAKLGLLFHFTAFKGTYEFTTEGLLHVNIAEEVPADA